MELSLKIKKIGPNETYPMTPYDQKLDFIWRQW